MKTDLFISYAWTSEEHREWVRLFASQIHLLGYNVKIDEKVDYGSSLSGFMKEVTNSQHVLLVMDENYVDRANNKPESGVGIETEWIKSVFDKKSDKWLSVVFVKNPNRKLPAWLEAQNPKGFDFNSAPERDEFPGSVQIDEVWRWIEGLPADKSNAVPLSELRKRSSRIEKIIYQKDPSNFCNPALSGSVTFQHGNNKDFTVGHSEYKFSINFSGRSHDSVYVYTDSELNAVGLIKTEKYERSSVESFLTPARAAEPIVGQSVVLMNSHGVLCIIKIDEVQREVNTGGVEYIPGHVTFSYEILSWSDGDQV
jgi:hypothetical protein